MKNLVRQRANILAVLLLLASPAWHACAQQWFANYRDGRQALREGKYQEAVSLFSQAIAQRSDSKADARTYGVKFIDYFPYLYRGIAYAKLGDRTSALKDFEQEHAAGEVYRGERDVAAGALMRKHLDEYRAATVAHQPVPVSAHDDVPDSLFRMGVSEFEQGGITRSKALFLDVRKRRPTYAGLDDYLSRIRSFEQDVRKGIAAFLNGKYDQAIETLTPAAARGRGHVNTQAFLGCSHAARYLLSGGEKEDDREKAIEAFQLVKQLDPGFDLKRTYVSPAIEELFSAAPVGEDARRKIP